MAKVNYSDSQTAKAREMYVALRAADEKPDNDTVLDTIGTEIGKSRKSVRAKLVREGVFVADTKPEAAPKDDGPTKKEKLQELDLLSVNTKGADGATKEFLDEVIRLAKAAA